MSKPPSLRLAVPTLRWPDLAVFPLVLALSILPLLWFGRNWIAGTDGSRYLLLGWNLISGEGYTLFGYPYLLRGPGFPGLLGGLMLLSGRDVDSLAWTARLLTLANPVLMYFLIKRIAGPMAGLLAAAMVTLFGYTATFTEAFHIDAVQLTLYLLAALVLLIGAQKDRAVLWLLSGLLLGTAILTKETSLVALPLALFAALLFRRSFRGVLLHYTGVVTVCLPWWVWVWAVSGNVYLIGRFPPKVIVSVVVAALAMAALFVGVSYRSGIVTRLLAKERWRRGVGWFVVLAPTAVLLVVVLGTNYLPLGDGKIETIPNYITNELTRDISLWYLLPFASVYVLWETVRGHQLWGFYLALLVLHVPVLLIVLQNQWATRQWLIPEALLCGALAGLVVKVLRASIWEGRQNLYRSLAFGAAAVLIIGLVQATVVQVRLLSDDKHLRDKYGNSLHVRDHENNDLNSSVRDMHDWIAANIPEGEKIVTTQHYASQLAFLEGMQHGWTLLQLDGCRRPPDGECRPDSELIAQAPPQPAVWFDMNEDCKGQALSPTALEQQMEGSGSTYLLTTQERISPYPFNLAWAPYLESSGAFEVVYSSYLPGALTTERPYGLVLLKWAGQKNPGPTSTQATLMSATTVDNLLRCEAPTKTAHKKKQAAQRISSRFPNGIEIFGTPEQVAQAQESAARYGLRLDSIDGT